MLSLSNLLPETEHEEEDCGVPPFHTSETCSRPAENRFATVLAGLLSCF